MFVWRDLLANRQLHYDVDDTGEIIDIAVGSAYATESCNLSPFERDYCRLIYSNSFRRLARKTQVHPFAEVDYVSNRLTHSLEVSTVASSILREIRILFNGKEFLTEKEYEDAAWILRAAGLAHDLGNPPYGHAGEAVIRLWASSKEAKKILPQGVLLDFQKYDGNAQTFRLLCRHRDDDCKFLGLTVPTIATVVKYPIGVQEADLAKPKFSAFASEHVLFDKLMRALGLKRRKGHYCRHPLSFILEAADDICYVFSDLEDAKKLRIASKDEVQRLYEDFLPKKKPILVGDSLSMLRTAVIGILIKMAAAGFKNHYNEIMTGSVPMGRSLVEHMLPQGYSEKFALLKDEHKKLFATHHTIAAEIKGYSELTSILSRMMPLLLGMMPDKKGAISFYGEHILALTIGNGNRKTHCKWTKERWAHIFLDYISGMTDDFVRAFAGRL